ncbi:hypothetical protein VPHF89G1_0033 [Vibrio phage F89 g1]
MEKPLSIKLHKLLLSEFVNSSQNLAKFARSRKYSSLKSHYGVYKDSNGELHLGFIDDTKCFCGRKLIRLACGDHQTFAYAIENPTDVTEWFIDEYKEKGMCAYTDMRHEWIKCGDDQSLPDGYIRVCDHCGKEETLKSKMVRKIWWE